MTKLAASRQRLYEQLIKALKDLETEGERCEMPMKLGPTLKERVKDDLRSLPRDEWLEIAHEIADQLREEYYESLGKTEGSVDSYASKTVFIHDPATAVESVVGPGHCRPRHGSEYMEPGVWSAQAIRMYGPETKAAEDDEEPISDTMTAEEARSILESPAAYSRDTVSEARRCLEEPGVRSTRANRACGEYENGSKDDSGKYDLSISCTVKK